MDKREAIRFGRSLGAAYKWEEGEEGAEGEEGEEAVTRRFLEA